MTTPTATPKSNLTPEQVSDLGERIYREKIRPTLTEADIGRFVAIDVHSGEHEIDDEDVAATIRLHKRIPDAFSYGIRVGYSAAYFFGGYDEEPEL